MGQKGILGSADFARSGAFISPARGLVEKGLLAASGESWRCSDPFFQGETKKKKKKEEMENGARKNERGSGLFQAASRRPIDSL